MKSDNLARSLAMMEDELKRAEEGVKIADLDWFRWFVTWSVKKRHPKNTKNILTTGGEDDDDDEKY